MTVSAGGWVVLCADGVQRDPRLYPDRETAASVPPEDCGAGPEHTVHAVRVLVGPLAEDETLLAAVSVALEQYVVLLGHPDYPTRVARAALAAVDAAIGGTS